MPPSLVTAASAAFAVAFSDDESKVGVGVGVGLGIVPTTFPVAVVLIDPGEFSPTTSELPLHAANTIRLAPVQTVRRIAPLHARQ